MSRFHFMAICVLVVVGALSYSNSFQNGFVYDDTAIIVNSQAIKHLNVLEIFRENPARFVGTLSFALSYHFFELNVIGYHLASLVIHVLTASCLYFLVYLVTRDRYKEARFIALFTACLFLVHPIQTQAVTYLSQRFTVLSGLFYVSTLLLYILWKRTGSLLYYLISLATLILALFTKESTYTIPLALLLLDISTRNLISGNVKKRVILLGGYFFITLLVLLTTRIVPIVFTHSSGTSVAKMTSIGESPQIPSLYYMLTQPRVVLTYMRLLILPIHQNLDYDYRLVQSIGSIRFIVPLLLIFISVLTGFLALRKYPVIAFGLLFFFLSLVVESSVIPLADSIAEHRLYVPSFGAILLFVTVLFELKKPYIVKKYRKSILIAIVIVCIGMTLSRNLVWKNEVTLFTDVVQKSPNKPKPLGNLGAALLNQNRLDESLTYLLKAERIDTSYAYIYNNIGVVFQRKGQTEKAIDYYEKALLVEPSYPNAGNNIAALLYANGQYEKALIAYQNVLRYHPDDPQAHNGVAVTLFILGKKDEAVEYLKKAIKLDPSSREYQNNLSKMQIAR